MSFNGEILLDIISFPRSYFDSDENSQVDFGTVRHLSTKWKDEQRNVNRVMARYNPITKGFKVSKKNPENLSFSPNQSSGNPEYQSLIEIKNLNPQQSNYIIRFRTLSKDKVHYSLEAIYNGENVALANQVVEVDSQTATMNMFQRVKEQQRSFAPLQPGLDFALFSDQTISK